MKEPLEGIKERASQNDRIEVLPYSARLVAPSTFDWRRGVSAHAPPLVDDIWRHVNQDHRNENRGVDREHSGKRAIYHSSSDDAHYCQSKDGHPAFGHRVRDRIVGLEETGPLPARLRPEIRNKAERDADDDDADHG